MKPLVKIKVGQMRNSIALWLVLFSFPLTRASAQEQSPEQYLTFTIPQGVPTAADQKVASLKFWLTQLDLYKSYTKDLPAMRPRALAFLEASIRHPYQQWEVERPGVTSKELLQQALKLLEEKNSDPLVMMHCADALVANGFGGEAKALSVRFDRILKRSAYPPALQILAADRKRRCERAVGGVDAIMAAKKEFVELTPAWLEWAKTNDGWQRPALEFVVDVLGEREIVVTSAKLEAELLTHFQKLIQGYQKSDQSDLWISEMLLGFANERLAWKYRGSGMIDTVTRTGFKNFEKHLTIAAKHFNHAYQENPDRPEAAAKMIAISSIIEVDTGTQYEWFTRCLSAEVDYKGAYASMLTFRLSRWGGSPEAILEFGEYCGATSRYDTQITLMYVEALRTLCRSEKVDWPELLSRPGVYKKIEYVLTHMADHPSRKSSTGLSNSQSVLLTWLLCLSMRAERFEEAAKLYERLGDNISMPTMAYYGYPHQPKYIRSRVSANLEFHDELVAIRTSSSTPRTELKDSQKTNESFRELLKRSEDVGSKYYLQTWIDRTQYEIDFHSGEWVDLPFDSEFVHWTHNSVNWTFENPGSALASNERENASVHLYHMSEFPGPKEITVETELIESAAYKLPTGISIGELRERSGGRLFFSDPLQNTLGITYSNDFGKMSEAKLPRAMSSKPPIVGINQTKHAGAGIKSMHKLVKLQLKYWGPKKFEFRVNGNVFPAKTVPEMNSTPSDAHDRVGIGDQHWMQYSGIVRFKNVRIRKLADSP